MDTNVTLILDYAAGNLASVRRACAHVGLQARYCSDPEQLLQAERIIFPGVGAAGSAMRSLKQRGLDEALHDAIGRGTPVLGICLGMQVSFTHSEENDTDTLDLIPGRVRRFAFDRKDLKIPHMGWNEVRVVKPHPVLADIEAGDEFYFVHSYYPQPASSDAVLATTDYEGEFTCAVGKDNYIGTQFHPEKSAEVGLRLLANFAVWDGQC
ncbi:MAG: imidazole glycerol phosphate synthase subunit HisH [Gammaproteobacteria bacterium TMED92]|nr:MAG: imidazole glycerol phosphate synthase subunit HisH [Gammaproteobacteria bacterium TMED92]